MRRLPAPSAAETLRVHAVARLMLDNIPHVKAFWIATGVQVAQASLWFGVDDLDGTVQEERIYHMAGATSPEAMTPQQLRKLIRLAGREPVERDTLYNVVPERTPEPRVIPLAPAAARIAAPPSLTAGTEVPAPHPEPKFRLHNPN